MKNTKVPPLFYVFYRLYEISESMHAYHVLYKGNKLTILVAYIRNLRKMHP